MAEKQLPEFLAVVGIPFENRAFLSVVKLAAEVADAPWPRRRTGWQVLCTKARHGKAHPAAPPWRTVFHSGALFFILCLARCGARGPGGARLARRGALQRLARRATDAGCNERRNEARRKCGCGTDAPLQGCATTPRNDISKVVSAYKAIRTPAIILEVRSLPKDAQQCAPQ